MSGGDHRQRFDLAALKARHSLIDVVARWVKLRRAGREMAGLCPFHNERTPSFYVNEARGVYLCRGCGASGDVVTFLVEKEGVEFLEAVRMLNDGELPQVDPIERERAARRETAERLASIAEAKALWASARPATGTPAEVYARSRGITIPLPGSVRFAMTPAWRKPDTGEVGPDLPAAIFAIQNKLGEVTGVQRIFLARGGTAKAAMKRPKLSLGNLVGGVVRLGPVAREVIIVEGPEDGLTLVQGLPGRSVWVACGTSLMPLIELPDEVEAVTLAGDNNAAGRAAVAQAAEVFTEQGRRVQAVYPDPAFKDWNDELRGIRL